MSRAPAPCLPDVSPWGLPDYYRRLKAKLLELEEAWEEERLAPLLDAPEILAVVGSSVLEVYRKLAADHRPTRHPFRRTSIHVVCEELKDYLREPRWWFPARAIEGADRRGEAACDFVVTPAGAESPRTVPEHQAIAGRFWGIGLELEDPPGQARFTRALLRHVLDRLASDVAGIRRVERWLRRTPRIEPATRVAPDESGRRFEHLVLDVLNEHRHLARHAPLYEDFVEKTDLRVRAPGLARRRGARVQVTQTIDRNLLDAKVARIRRAEEFVVLSPLTLAEAIADREHAAALLEFEELADLWEALPHDFATVHELAEVIRRQCRDALDRPPTDPRGPLAFLPRALRALIRHFVFAESHRATRCLRRRQGRDG